MVSFVIFARNSKEIMSKNSYDEKKYIKGFWIIILSPFALLFLILLLTGTGLLGFMPTFEDLENPRSSLASEVISDDGALLGKYFFVNRSYVSFDELSPNAVNALIATEDIRFYKHTGVDLRGLGRVFFKTILLGSNSSGGGSTITQQLAKNLFPRDTTSNHSFITRKGTLALSKFKEWITAVKLERNYTKEEILSMYLNTVPFGGNAYGIKSASKIFFNVEPKDLKIEQAALLIGLLKAPTAYSPVLNPERSLTRRNVVLKQMNKYHFITDEQYDSLCRLPIRLNYKPQDHNDGIATYYRELLRIIMSAEKPERGNYYSDDQYSEDSLEWATNPLYGWCNKNRKPDGTIYNLYKDGLKIYTTIDSRLQALAEKAMQQHLMGSVNPAFLKEKKGRKNGPFASNLPDKEVKQLLESSMKRTDRYRALKKDGVSEEEIDQNFHKRIKMRILTLKGEKDTVMSPWDSIRYYKYFLRASLMSMDPHTGYIRAYVGGPNFKYFKYDQVKLGRRQVGSTIKPFLYTLAMQEGYSPCQLVPNLPVTFEVGDTTWTPKNSGKTKHDGEMVTLKWGLANSVNYISAWLMQRFNPLSMIDVMRKMGITGKIDAVPSLLLGTPDISLYEMTAAYCTFADKGVYTKPLMVTRIEDKTGNVIATFKPNRVEALNEKTAYLMINLMEGVINGGTGSRVRYMYGLTNPIAGKTGTTQNHSDGWFIGVTPSLVTGVWVGGEDRSIHFDNLSMGQGASMALPIWGIYMKSVYADPKIGLYNGDFERPSGVIVDTNCSAAGGASPSGETQREDDYME
jgi:penicillin-binding protein 1A